MEQKKLYTFCNSIMYSRGILNQLYTNNTRPIRGIELVMYPILASTTMILPIYLTKGDSDANFKWMNSKYHILCLSLFCIGSFISSFSELQRKWFKQKTMNKGKLYTNGLFSISRHPNYFGQLLLFCGWYGLCKNYKIMIAPLLMTFSFVFHHIPELEQYLSKRYPNEWQEYAQNVKSFIPFVC